MNGNDFVNVVGVAAAHRNRNGKTRFRARLHDDLVTAPQSFDGHLQPPEPIPLERIGARKIEDEVGLMAVQDIRQVRAQQRQVLVVTGAVGERHIAQAPNMEVGAALVGRFFGARS